MTRQVGVSKRTFDELAQSFDVHDGVIVVGEVEFKYRGPRVATITHGTTHCYTKNHCRCAACKDAHKLYHRDYRATRRTLRQSRERRLL